MDFTIPLAPDAQGHSVPIDGVTYRALRRNSNDQLLVAVAAPYTPTSVAGGQLNVTTAGTRVQLPAQACHAATIRAKPTNTGKIYLGNVTVDSTHGLILSAGDGQDLAIDNLNRLWLDSSVSGEGISYLWVS